MGLIFATLSALFNGTIGIFNRLCFDRGLASEHVAILKCLTAFGILTLLLVASGGAFRQVRKTVKHWYKYATLAFCGMLLLFFFETLSFEHMPVANVAFTCLTSACAIAHLFDHLLGVSRLTRRGWLSIGLIVSGIFLLSSQIDLAQFSLKGVGYAIIGGAGYAGFMVFFRKFNLSCTVIHLWWIFGLGAITRLLLISPNFQTLSVTWETAGIILALAFFPTVGGFFLTTKALELATASRVQTVEMLEPVFAALFAAVIFSELLTGIEMAGASLASLGVILTIQKDLQTAAANMQPLEN